MLIPCMPTLSCQRLPLRTRQDVTRDSGTWRVKRGGNCFADFLSHVRCSQSAVGCSETSSSQARLHVGMGMGTGKHDGEHVHVLSRKEVRSCVAFSLLSLLRFASMNLTECTLPGRRAVILRYTVTLHHRACLILRLCNLILLCTLPDKVVCLPHRDKSRFLSGCMVMSSGFTPDLRFRPSPHFLDFTCILSSWPPLPATLLTSSLALPPLVMSRESLIIHYFLHNPV